MINTQLVISIAIISNIEIMTIFPDRGCIYKEGYSFVWNITDMIWVYKQSLSISGSL